jgi:AcrR family transcriptional regulator
MISQANQSTVDRAASASARDVGASGTMSRRQVPGESAWRQSVRRTRFRPERALVPVPRGPRGQLPGGKHLPADVVSADQRERLLRAVVAVVAARGRASTRVRDVLRCAGVSQKTLYTQFAGLDDLLLSACDAWLADLLDDVERAVAGRGLWAQGIRDGLRCLLEGVAAHPDLGHCCFLELCALGTAGEKRRLRALEQLAAALRPGSTGERPRGRLHVSDELVAGGVWHAVEAAILSTGTRGLVSLLPGLHAHVLGYGAVRQDTDRAA